MAKSKVNRPLITHCIPSKRCGPGSHRKQSDNRNHPGVRTYRSIRTALVRKNGFDMIEFDYRPGLGGHRTPQCNESSDSYGEVGRSTTSGVQNFAQ